MSLEFCILGSGSAGNSTVVRAASGGAAGSGGIFLIDAGFGPRATAQRLHGTGVALSDITAIVLTHLDSDHFNPNWLLTLIKQGTKIHLARSHLREFLRTPEIRDLRQSLPRRNLPDDALDSLLIPFDDALEPLPGVRMHALPLAHDEAGSHGFLIECHGYRAGYATDLGTVPDQLIERFCGVDLLALESNYDPFMEENSPRPPFLKQRIMGGRGHLSNEQAFAAICAILDRTQAQCGPDRLPRHIVLLHRSRQCNCPKLLQKFFSADPRIAPVLTLADQHERTAWLHPRRGRAQHVEQLTLSWA
jgi:phosphoribosyl 1,2-cyclic phosphodiesterase